MLPTTGEHGTSWAAEDCFDALLQVLSKEHHKVVNSLREEIRQLRGAPSWLARSTTPAAVCADPELLALDTIHAFNQVGSQPVEEKGHAEGSVDLQGAVVALQSAPSPPGLLLEQPPLMNNTSRNLTPTPRMGGPMIPTPRLTPALSPSPCASRSMMSAVAARHEQMSPTQARPAWDDSRQEGKDSMRPKNAAGSYRKRGSQERGTASMDVMFHRPRRRSQGGAQDASASVEVAHAIDHVAVAKYVSDPSCSEPTSSILGQTGSSQLAKQGVQHAVKIEPPGNPAPDMLVTVKHDSVSKSEGLSEQVSPTSLRRHRSDGSEGSKDGDMLQVRPIFRDKGPRNNSRVSDLRQWTTQTKAKLQEETGTVIAYDGFLRHFITTPSSIYRVYWEAIGAALVGFDLIFVPLSIIFLSDSDEEKWMQVVNIFSLVYWTVNVPATLFVGVIEDGVLVMKPTRILLNYAKTWLLWDLIVVIPEWTFGILAWSGAEESEGGGLVKLLRVWRLFRTTRLVRVLRLRWLLQVLTDWLQTEILGITINIIKMIILMFLLCHYVGCAWYLVGKASRDNIRSSWVAQQQANGEVEWYLLYLKSIHWAMAQFTPAPVDFHPMNLAERTFTVMVVMLALVCFSYVVGSITASLGQLRSMNEDFAKQAWNARRYLRQQEVPTHLSIRLLRFLEKRYERQRSYVQMESIPIFAHLSEYLYGELRSAVYLPHLHFHPLFEYMVGISQPTMQRLALNGMFRTFLAGGDFLFVPHDQPTSLGIILSGKLIYVKLDSVNVEVEETIDKGRDCILEQVLWTSEWICLGEAAAVADCEIQMVSAEVFSEVIVAIPAVRHLTTRYAQAFIKKLNSKKLDDLCDFQKLDDIEEIAEDIIKEFDSEMFSKQKVNRKSMSRGFSTLGMGGKRFTKRTNTSRSLFSIGRRSQASH